MSDTFLTFKLFGHSETAQDFAEVLKQNGIPYSIEEDALAFDPSYANNELHKDYRLKLRQEDFARANQVLADYYHALLDKVNKDHYLFEFTDGELREIIAKPDEWGHFDYQLAQKLLADRGLGITLQEIQELKSIRINELSKPETVKHSSIVSGYFFCFFFFPIGVFMGWNWGFMKKTLPDGQRVYVYDSNVQKHGRRIFTIGLVLFVLTIIRRIADGLFDLY